MMTSTYLTFVLDMTVCKILTLVILNPIIRFLIYREKKTCFLIHLKQGLKWAFLIDICSLSAVVVVVIVNFILYIYIFVFFTRTTGSISTNLSTNYPWVKEILICFKLKKQAFSPQNNNKIAKCTRLCSSVKNWFI